LFILLIVLFRCFQIAIRAEDKFFKIVSLSMGTFFGLGVLINSGVVMGLLPTKGLTLPFLSYGGSSLICLSFMFGLILNIEKQYQENKISTTF
jgi:cell division protein FtsW